MTLDYIRRILGYENSDAGLFYQVVEVASKGSAARTLVALMLLNKWLTLEQLAAITHLTPSTIICHAIPVLKRFDLIEEKEENGERKWASKRST